MAKGNEQMNFSELLPAEPPEGLLDYEPLKKKLKANALIYKVGWCYEPLEDRKVQRAEIHCTACGTKFYEPLCREYGCRGQAEIGWENEKGEVFTSGNNALCPWCGAEATTYHTSSFGGSKYKLLSRAYPITFHRIGDHLAMCSWYVERIVDKDGKIDHFVRRYEAYVSNGNKAVKLVGYFKMMWNISWLGRWEKRVKCVDSYREAEVVYEPSFSAMVGTEMENSKLDRYVREVGGDSYPVSYMQVYLKHPNVENLVSAGFAEIVNKLIEQNATQRTYYGNRGVNKDLEGIDWKKNRPCEMMRMTKQEFDYFREQGWNEKALVVWTKLKKAKADVHIRELPTFLKLNLLDLDAVLAVSSEPLKALRYLEKQKKKYAKDDADASMFCDYLQMAEKLKEDLKDPMILWPQRLKSAHDQLVPRIEDMKDQKLAPQFERRFEKLSRYCFEYDGLLIRPVRTQGEIRAEGRLLHHCVASYAERHAKGETAIFLVRKSEEPESAYYTLEYSERTGTVIQNRGKNNCSRTAKVQAFEKKWLEWIADGMKQIKKETKKNGKSKQRAVAATTAA